MTVHYYLATLTQYGTVDGLVDGPHSDKEGAQHAYHLHKQFGFVRRSGKEHAIAKVELEALGNENE